MMENYLTQERNENCILYTNINENFRDNYSNLFFTNGNGIEFTNGNPVMFVPFGREVPWTEYYKQTVPLEKLKEMYIDRGLEHSVSDTIKLVGGDYNKTYKQALKAVQDIKELPLKNMLSKTFWLETFDKDHYFPYLSLSDGYFKLQELNKNTETTLLRVAIAFVTAHIEFYSTIENDIQAITEYKCVIKWKWDKEAVQNAYETAMEDKDMLKRELKRLNNL